MVTAGCPLALRRLQDLAGTAAGRYDPVAILPLLLVSHWSVGEIRRRFSSGFSCSHAWSWTDLYKGRCVKDACCLIAV